MEALRPEPGARPSLSNVRSAQRTCRTTEQSAAFEQPQSCCSMWLAQAEVPKAGCQGGSVRLVDALPMEDCRTLQDVFFLRWCLDRAQDLLKTRPAVPLCHPTLQCLHHVQPIRNYCGGCFNCMSQLLSPLALTSIQRLKVGCCLQQVVVSHVPSEIVRTSASLQASKRETFP